MTRTVAVPLALLMVVLVALGGVLAARHLGESSGTPPSSKQLLKSCPGTTPEACVTMAASQLGLDPRVLPTISPTPARLRYERGWVVQAANGREVAQFDFADPRKHYIYNLGFVRMEPPVRDSAPVRVTPGGRKYRAVENQPLGLRYVLYESHLAVVVQVIGPQIRGTGVPGTAEALLDSVQLKGRPVDP